MIILDTDTFSLLASGQPQVAAKYAEAASEAMITVITRVEALTGRFAFILRASDGANLLRAQEWLRRTEADLSLFTAIPFNGAAANEFDRLREDKKLKKIGRADLLIASIALANRAMLVTRNPRHFREISGLQLENWAD